MELSDIGAIQPLVPWQGFDKIPWHEPAFSKRMLREHLSQEHGRASRRFGTIDQHVAWIHEHVLGGTAGRVLDLGCGPGFYTERLALRGHSCVGFDFSPASVAHAQAEAERAALPCEYRLEDLKVADFGSGFDLVLLVFGELNAFAPSEAGAILAKARRAIAPSGSLLLEAHSEEHVRSLGARAPTWFRAQRGLFSDEPHLCLTECAWHPDFRATTEQYFVVSLPSSEVSHYVSTSQAYSDREYLELLHGAGFPQVDRHASLTGERVDGEDGLFVWIARA